MAGKKPTPKTTPKTTPIKKELKRAAGADAASAPNSPAGRGTPRRATATQAVEKMKKMAVKSEMDVDEDAFDGDEDYDQAPSEPSSGRATPKKYRARVVNGSAPPTPTSKRCVYRFRLRYTDPDFAKSAVVRFGAHVCAEPDESRKSSHGAELISYE